MNFRNLALFMLGGILAVCSNFAQAETGGTYTPSSPATSSDSPEELELLYVQRRILDVRTQYPRCPEAIKCILDRRLPVTGASTAQSVSVHFYKYHAQYADPQKKQSCPHIDDQATNPRNLFENVMSPSFFAQSKNRILSFCKSTGVEVIDLQTQAQRIPATIPNPNFQYQQEGE